MINTNRYLPTFNGHPARKPQAGARACAGSSVRPAVALLLLVTFMPLFAATTPASAPPRPNDLRLVSLVPSITELAAAIDLGSSLCGVSNYCNWPPDVASLPKVGALDLNLEAIAKLQPTHALDLNAMHERWYPTLEKLKISVVNVRIDHLDDIPAAARQLAQTLGTPESANNFLASWTAERNRIAAGAIASRRRCYVEIWNSPPQGAGPTSFLGEMLTLAGGDNVLASGPQTFPMVNPESIVRGDPELILMIYPGARPDELARRPGWSAVTAVARSRVMALDWDIFVRPGPRSLEAVARLRDLLASDTPTPAPTTR